MEEEKKEIFYLTSCPICTVWIFYSFTSITDILKLSAEFMQVVESWVNIFFFMFLVLTLDFSVYFSLYFPDKKNKYFNFYIELHPCESTWKNVHGILCEKSKLQK